MAILPPLLQATTFSTPFLSTLLPSVGLAYTLQGLVAIPSILAQSERFYDLSGSLTYLSCLGFSLYLPALRARNNYGMMNHNHHANAAKPAWPSFRHALLGARAGAGAGVGAVGWDWRQVVLSAAVGVWATRLGSYLFRRISADGSDSRFDTIRTSPPKFLIAFFLQATWVSLCLMPVLAVNSLPASLFSALPASVAVTDVIGLLLYAGGLGFEVVADRQKDRWVQDKRAKKHDEDFLTHGLWSKSRHPNYFGEATLWTGIAVVAGGVLARNAGQVGMGLAKGWAAGGGGAAKAAAAAAAAGATMGISWKGRALGIGLAAVSPAFVTALLLFGSGVPMSEKKYDKKYGHRQDYQDWKRNTPVFWPKF